MHLVVLREHEGVEAVGAILEKETQRKISTALEGPRAKFADAEPAADVRLAECLPKFVEARQVLRPSATGQQIHPLKYGGVDDQGLFQTLA